jgi:hypothetical protein
MMSVNEIDVLAANSARVRMPRIRSLNSARASLIHSERRARALARLSGLSATIDVATIALRSGEFGSPHRMNKALAVARQLLSV